MTPSATSARPSVPTWIQKLPRRPLCDVPWLGRAVILSDGGVNFCCFSDAVVGNVNQAPLAKIWRGRKMRAIREELTRQRFPAECRSNSCPIFRGDEHTYLLDRMDGRFRFTHSNSHDPHAGERANLAASRIEINRPRLSSGEPLLAKLAVDYRGRWLAVDLFAAVTFPDGAIRFLPEFVDFPVPLRQYVELALGREPWSQTLIDRTIDASIAPGTYQLCVALIVHDSNPSVASNCYWSAVESIVVEAAKR